MATIGGSPPFWEKDGALRAYANRVLIFALALVAVVMALAGDVLVTRVKPPTIIRIGPNGEASVVSPDGQPKPGASMNLGGSDRASEAPTGLEKTYVVSQFVKLYWGYDEHTIAQNWATALSMMTRNLEQSVYTKMQQENTVGQLQDKHSRSDVAITSTQVDPADPMVYHVFATRTVSQITDQREVAHKLAEAYTIRLVETDRSAGNPNGLLVGDFSLQQISSDSATTGSVGQ